jgi:hypothetical protein
MAKKPQEALLLRRGGVLAGAGGLASGVPGPAGSRVSRATCWSSVSIRGGGHTNRFVPDASLRVDRRNHTKPKKVQSLRRVLRLQLPTKHLRDAECPGEPWSTPTKTAEMSVERSPVGADRCIRGTKHHSPLGGHVFPLKLPRGVMRSTSIDPVLTDIVVRRGPISDISCLTERQTGISLMRT